ncbi:MAG TPA: LacI family DNA-binding transcriptional regulator [Bacteroidota bacterium]|nr:LacI family DNA-binding transcriptional regulator [Bacteroidota bacterium]
MAATLRDIAQKSGLSISIVSRVLNKKTAKYRISKQTEKRVLQTAKDLNYRPNQLARGLRLRKTHTIGLVAPDISNPFFASIIKTAEGVAHSLGYTLVVCDSDESSQLEVEHVGLLQAKGVDGLIVLPVGMKRSHLDAVIAGRVPLVTADRSFPDLRASSVVIDNHAGAMEAIEHVVEHGHVRIAIIQGLRETITSRERLRGYLDVLAAHDIPVDEGLIVGNDFRRETGYVETLLLLRSRRPPTAIFTTSDLITLGALQAIFEQGLEVPRDISVVAFDDIESAEFFRCPITAVSQPKESIGEIAVKLLTDHIRDQRGSYEIRSIVLKPTLIVRDSVASIQAPAESSIG